MAEGEKIYIASAVARAPEEFVSDIQKLRELCRLKGYEVLEYIGSAPATPQEVFKHDLEQVLSANKVLAECTYPSTGLGYEIATALQEGIPVIAVAREGEKISRLVEGIEHELYSFRRYKEISEVSEFI